MPKLMPKDKFIDLSYYGRLPGSMFAKLLVNTSVTPIQITLLFGLVGLLAVFCIIKHYFLLAGILIILKSIIDAADGELARLKKTPSYSGRYLDSIFDIILNSFILLAICFISSSSILICFLSFLAIQLQGTLYNYYYVILRNKSVSGDSTSKVFEYKTPVAFAIEKQSTVNFLFKVYIVCYGVFDAVIHYLDKKAYRVVTFPNWFMTLSSIYGLGFQLLIIAIMLALNLQDYIEPFFIFYSVFIFLIIFIRKSSVK